MVKGEMQDLGMNVISQESKIKQISNFIFKKKNVAYNNQSNENRQFVRD